MVVTLKKIKGVPPSQSLPVSSRDAWNLPYIHRGEKSGETDETAVAKRGPRRRSGVTAPGTAGPFTLSTRVALKMPVLQCLGGFVLFVCVCFYKNR